MIKKTNVLIWLANLQVTPVNHLTFFLTSDTLGELADVLNSLVLKKIRRLWLDGMLEYT